eukprot:TRINITY_DN2291_c0_g2_i1.p2 TRINITY_DN2291_c0_g2~~TRINITY_DN2291_c0_g2_i1.p2  ORF type:complete len:151 (+),score=11.75 TRINITY_DN2291_c0_g2_i1:128-580(+)
MCLAVPSSTPLVKGTCKRFTRCVGRSALSRAERHLQVKTMSTKLRRTDRRQNDVVLKGLGANKANNEYDKGIRTACLYLKDAGVGSEKTGRTLCNVVLALSRGQARIRVPYAATVQNWTKLFLEPVDALPLQGASKGAYFLYETQQQLLT